MIKETFYKDRPAIELKNDNISALFLPLDGAKLVSLKDKDGMEFLAQRNGEKYRRLGIDTSYIEAECSAFDDMFPAIDPCIINGMEYLDHGEVARREHKVEVTENLVRFTCELEKLNIIYKKTAFFENEKLCIKYEIENLNNFDFPYVWAGHIMFKGENGAYAKSSFPYNAPKTIMFGAPKTQEPHKLPPIGNKQYKFYYTDSYAPLKCGIVYPESRKEINIEFCQDIVKYLGIWVNPGDLNNMYNIALEPCTALYDNPVNAQEANTASFIKANEKIEFTMKITQSEVQYG